MEIRKATHEDKKEIIRLLIAFGKADNHLSQYQRKIRAYTHVEKAAEDAVKKYLSQPEWIVFVADNDGILVGLISGEIKEKKHRVYHTEGYVDVWFVEKEYRDQKIGKKLFDKLMEAFKKSGCTHIGLETNLENKKVIEIYEHMELTKRLVSFFKPLQNLP